MIIGPKHPLARSIVIKKPDGSELTTCIAINTDTKVISCLELDKDGQPFAVDTPDGRDVAKVEVTYDDTWNIYMNYTAANGTENPNLDDVVRQLEEMRDLGFKHIAPESYKRFFEDQE